MPAASDLAGLLRVGSAESTADAVTRSHLSDGRVVGWYGPPEPGARVAIDAEIASQPVPPALARRFGDEGFWERWTAAECAAKLADVPILLWIRAHGLDPAPYLVETVRLDDLVVSVGRMPVRVDRIEIVGYDPSWPGSFARERGRLEPVLAPLLAGPLEHIGSTSVPGLPAKPIIDMLAVITNVDDVSVELVGRLRSLGWVHAPEPSDATARKRSFCSPSISFRTHHLHVVEHGSASWPTWLAFRDHLRAHPEIAGEYAAVKRQAAASHAEDRVAYRAAKAPLIRRVLNDIASPPSGRPGSTAG